MKPWLTREVLALGYTFLRGCEPFCKWGLPSAHKVKFRVVRDKSILADFSAPKGQPTIRVSINGAGHTITVIAALSHEMIHLKQWQEGDRETHGPRFQRNAKRVCALHGFDPTTF